MGAARGTYQDVVSRRAGCIMSAAIPKLPMWYRVLATIVGVASIVTAMIVLVEPFLAIWLLILLLAIGLLFMGMDRLAAGITGQPMMHVVGVVAPEDARGASPPSSSPPSPKP